MFDKHQKLLLKIANHPLGRKALDIRQSGQIIKITPNSTSVFNRFFMKDGVPWIERTTKVRVKNVYAKKLENAFKFGGVLAEGLRYFSSPKNYIPIPLFLGTTVTDRDSSSGDAELQEDSAWATAWSASSCDYAVTNGSAPFVRAATNQIKRGYIPWSVSGEPSGDVVSAAHVDLYTGSSFEDPDSDTITMCIATPDTPGTPVVGDFDQLKGTELVTRQTIADLADSSYHEWVLNGAGLTYLADSFGGFFDIGLVSGKLDYDHGTPTGAGDVSWATSETANDPHLTFTHAAPVATTDYLSEYRRGSFLRQ